MTALALVACGCGRNSPVAPDLKSSLLAPASSSSANAKRLASGPQHVEGSLGPGALYAMDVPDSWNGGLVLYVHGYSDPSSPVALPPLPLRDFLLNQGFAVAASSFSENGYAVAEGARQSHQLLGQFAERFGKPNCTLLVGVSMGGVIGLEL